MQPEPRTDPETRRARTTPEQRATIREWAKGAFRFTEFERAELAAALADADALAGALVEVEQLRTVVAEAVRLLGDVEDSLDPTDRALYRLCKHLRAALDGGSGTAEGSPKAIDPVLLAWLEGRHVPEPPPVCRDCGKPMATMYAYQGRMVWRCPAGHFGEASTRAGDGGACPSSN